MYYRRYTDRILESHIEAFGWGIKIVSDNENGTVKITTVGRGEEMRTLTNNELIVFISAANCALNTRYSVLPNQESVIYSELEGKLGVIE